MKPDATQEEIDDMLESGKTDVFGEQILDTKRHEMAKDALAYIENKHKDILRLEQSIQELHQLFLDMAILVEAQGELIDQIEFNVNQSVAYTKEAVKQIEKAGQEQRKSRKVTPLFKSNSIHEYEYLNASIVENQLCATLSFYWNHIHLKRQMCNILKSNLHSWGLSIEIQLLLYLLFVKFLT